MAIVPWGVGYREPLAVAPPPWRGVARFDAYIAPRHVDDVALAPLLDRHPAVAVPNGHVIEDDVLHQSVRVGAELDGMGMAPDGRIVHIEAHQGAHPRVRLGRPEQAYI